MTISGIFSSRTQRRQLMLISVLSLSLGIVGVFLTASIEPPTTTWSAINSLCVSVVAGGLYASMSSCLLFYFFKDPYEIARSSVLLPQDIKHTLSEIAKTATEYTIFARTGRHFRAEIVPILQDNARIRRRKMNINVILLDFRDAEQCEKYADYRRTGSFDRELWDLRYVRKEVLATIIKLLEVQRENRSFMQINLFLSRRLSTFRIEGSADELVVTREDPKDIAASYKRPDPNFDAYLNELTWICAEASRIHLSVGSDIKVELGSTFPEHTCLIDEIFNDAHHSIADRSPYVR